MENETMIDWKEHLEALVDGGNSMVPEEEHITAEDVPLDGIPLLSGIAEAAARIAIQKERERLVAAVVQIGKTQKGPRGTDLSHHQHVIVDAALDRVLDAIQIQQKVSHEQFKR